MVQLPCALLSLPCQGRNRLPAPSASGVGAPGVRVVRGWGAFWLEDSVLPCFVLQIVEAMPDHIMAPGVVPAVVGKLIVTIVLERDVSVGPPRPMGMALGVIAAPTGASLTTALLATTAPPPPPGENQLKKPAPLPLIFL